MARKTTTFRYFFLILNIIVKNNADCVFIFCRAKFNKLESFVQRFFGFSFRDEIRLLD